MELVKSTIIYLEKGFNPTEEFKYNFNPIPNSSYPLIPRGPMAGRSTRQEFFFYFIFFYLIFFYLIFFLI